MNDYVARADAVKAACKLCPFACVNTEVCPTRDVVFRAIPPADVRPVVRGTWLPFRSQAAGNIQYCSSCGLGCTEKTNFCPTCGADMRGEPDGA